MRSRAMLSRRTFLQLMGATAAMGTLAGCVAPVAPSGAGSAGSAAEAGVDMQIWINWGGIWHEAIQQIADNYVANNPQHSIEVLPGQSGTEGMTKFLAAIAGNNAPDLYTTGAVNGAMLTERGVLMPVTPDLEGSSINIADFVEAQLNYYMKDGELYGIPTVEGAAGQAIIWNKAHFEEVGLDPEAGPQSFDELVEFAAALDQFDEAGNIVRLGFDPRDARGADLLGWWFERQWYDPAAAQVHLATENLVWGAEWVADFARRVGAEKMSAFRQEYATWTGDPRSGFVRGAQSMLMSGYYVPGELARLAPEIEAGYTWVPTRDNKKVSTIYGWFWVRPTNCPNPEVAWDFVEHASTVDSINIIYNTAGGYPTYTPFIEQADFSQYEGLQWFVDSAFEAEDFYTAPPLPIAPGEVTDRLVAGLDEMTFGEITAQEMLTRVESEVQPLIDQAVTM